MDNRIDKRLEIFKVFCYQICNWFEDKLTYDVKYSSGGNNVDMILHGYPLYRSATAGDVVLRVPASYVRVGASGIVYGQLKQGDVRFVQGKTGEGFAHPHVWHNGEPCWDHVDKSNPVDLYAYIVNSLLLTNVTKDSITHGKMCPDSSMKGATMDSTLQMVKKYQGVIKSKLKLSDACFDTRNIGAVFLSRFTAGVNMVIKSS